MTLLELAEEHFRREGVDAEATINEMLFGSRVRFQCLCTGCGGFVTSAEPDARWVGGQRDMVACEVCGPGTEIVSEGILAEVMLF